MEPETLFQNIIRQHRAQSPGQIAATFFHMRVFGQPDDPVNHPLTHALMKGFYGETPFRVGFRFELEDAYEQEYSEFFLQTWAGGKLQEFQITGSLLYFMDHFLLGDYQFLRSGWRAAPARTWHSIKLKLSGL